MAILHYIKEKPTLKVSSRLDNHCFLVMCIWNMGDCIMCACLDVYLVWARKIGSLEGEC